MLLFVLFLFLPLIAARFYCGLDPLTNLFLEIHTKLDCNATLVEHDNCCMQHGFCYLRRMPYEECDNAYCNCVAPLAADGICKFHGDNFCNTVRMNGKNIYPIFTMDRGR